jgi:hypothetical protein
MQCTSALYKARNGCAIFKDIWYLDENVYEAKEHYSSNIVSVFLFDYFSLVFFAILNDAWL